MNWPIFNFLNEEHFTFHLQYKHSGLLTVNMKNFLPPKSENVRPFGLYSNSIENATPSSSTSPLASYKEVPPPWLGMSTASHKQ